PVDATSGSPSAEYARSRRQAGAPRTTRPAADIRRTTMRDVFRTLLLAGFGAIDLTAEKARGMMDDLVRRGELASDEASELTTAWTEGMRQRREAIDRQVQTAVEE